MNAYGIAVATLGIVMLLLAAAIAKASGVIPDDPDALKRTTSLGTIIATVRDRPVHLVFVHGMRAEGPGAAAKFRSGLCQYVPGGCPSGSEKVERKFLPLGPRPNAVYLGTELWRTDAEWAASTPFVDRYIIPRAQAEPIIVDEVNWWRLLFPPKCRLIVPEIDLSGADRDHLKLCANKQPPYYPWLSESELNEALARKPKSRGGALLNRSLKQQIMNWGLTDAVLALGPLREYFRKAMDKAFEYASRYDAKDVDNQEFVVVSESLGSFVVLDAFNNLYGDSRKAKDVGDRTADLYFFANQFALLQLGRIDVASKAAGARSFSDAVLPEVASPVDLLQGWAQSGVRTDLIGRPKQIIAFSDPSDLLTYQVPKIRDPKTGRELAIVVNVYDRNEINWLGLFALPTSAHTGHSGNKSVLKLVFRTQ